MIPLGHGFELHNKHNSDDYTICHRCSSGKLLDKVACRDNSFKGNFLLCLACGIHVSDGVYARACFFSGMKRASIFLSDNGIIKLP